MRGNGNGFGAFGNMVELALSRAERDGEKTAYIFLKQGERESGRLTYSELLSRSWAVGAKLRDEGAAGKPVILAMAAADEFVPAFFGCMLAGAIAVPVFVPRSGKRLENLVAIARDCGARHGIAGGSRRPALESAAVRWIDESGFDDKAPLAPASPDPDSIAFLQYTSGSTGSPKGVMVTHRNILANQEMMRRGFRHGSDTVVVSWLPQYHDMGLIGSILHPAYLGRYSVLMSPESFLQKPFRWLEAISRYRATTSGGPNFAYQRCVDSPDELTEDLDLSCWRVAFSGAEPVRARTMAAFAARFARAGFRYNAFFPCYGLAEATLFVTGGHIGESAVIEHESCRAELTGCGPSTGFQEVAIVSPERLEKLPDNSVGEIWVKGASVAAGYWGKPADPRLNGVLEGDGPYLRTGDLGFVRDGQLFIAGRIKNTIIIRGRNYFAEDLESAIVDSHPDIMPGHCAAFAVDNGGEEQFVVVQEVRRERLRHFDAASVCNAIRSAVAAAYEIQPDRIALIRPATIPRTTSGKVRHQTCKEEFVAGVLELAAPVWEAAKPVIAPALRPAFVEQRVDVLQWLIARVSEHLGRPAAGIDVEESFAALGLESMSLIAITEDLCRLTGRELSPTLLWEHPSIARVAAHLAEPDPAGRAPEAPAGVILAARAPSAAMPLVQ